MDVLTEQAVTSRRGRPRWRTAPYWLCTAGAAAELGAGGALDVTGNPSVRDLVAHLGYPSYFLVLLGTWKMLGAVALLIPGRALLKEWAYAGAFFTYTGAIVSHLTTGYALGEVPVLIFLTALTIGSWALRPTSRRSPLAAPARHDR
jgi:DoxX-like family